MKTNIKSLKNLPGENGFYGEFGESFVPLNLIEPLKEIEEEYEKAKNDPAFLKEYSDLLTNYVGRPSPTILCKEFNRKIRWSKNILKT